jgi:glycine oxidase
MNPSPDVIVVGGGVIGCSIAFYLAKAGVSATLLERGRIGAEASAAASGLLGPSPGTHPYTRLTTESYAMFPALVDELERTGGVDVELVNCGKLEVALSEDEALELRKWGDELEALGGEARWLDQTEALDLEPQLSPQVIGAVHMPDISKVNNRRLSDAFAIAGMRLGAEVRQGAEVVGLTRSGQRVTGVRLRGEEIHADHIVIAAGAWSGTLAASLGLAESQAGPGQLDKMIPVYPMRGQNTNLQPTGEGIRTALGYRDGIFVPQSDGSTIAGPTLEDVGFDSRVTAGGVQSILNLATTVIPSLEDANINWTIAGLRPGSPDEMPIMGPVTGWDGLVVASGHYRSGIHLSPITGKLIADHITGQKPELLAAFSPDRFARS